MTMNKSKWLGVTSKLLRDKALWKALAGLLVVFGLTTQADTLLQLSGPVSELVGIIVETLSQ